jgi:hypothetical protein
VLLTLCFLYMLGYVASAYFLGRIILRPPTNRFLAYLVGWGILSVAAAIPFLNAIVLIAATVYGLGMIVVAVLRARRGPRETAPAVDRRACLVRSAEGFVQVGVALADRQLAQPAPLPPSRWGVTPGSLTSCGAPRRLHHVLIQGSLCSAGQSPIGRSFHGRSECG